MRFDLRFAAALVIILGAALGTAFALSRSDASDGDAEARYEVTVAFNSSVTQQDIEETAALLRTYDDALDFLVMESFPPIGRAVVATETAGFCDAVRRELEAKEYIGGVTCWPPPAGDAADPHAPVSSDRSPQGD